MRKSTNSAFTLVELIVVITILAVLGTIAFISLQGYSADARNSKRTSDINNIQSAMWIKQAEGGSLVAFVNTATTTPRLTWTVNFAGTGSTTADYLAGTLNYTALGVKADEFKDPTDQEYRMGLTTTGKGRFELAATLEDGADKVALVKGTYVSRNAADTNKTATIDSLSNKIVTLAGANTNAFSRGDFVNVTGGATAQNGLEIKKVARDWITLTFGVDINSDHTTITLASDESTGLIADTTTTTAPVINGSTTLRPY